MVRENSRRIGQSLQSLVDDAGNDEELSLILEMRDRQADQRRLRAEMLTDLDERVEVRCRLHLLEAEAESMLLGRLRELDDRLAVVRHCDSHSDHLLVEVHNETHHLRLALAAQVDAVVVEVVTAIGQPPRGGADWSLGDVPGGAQDNIADAWAALRRDLVRVVDHLVASDLVRPAGTSRGMVDVVLREHDDESVARVRAVAAEIRRLDDTTRRCAERVRHIALRLAHANPRSWLAQNQLRSRQAREALDLVRAVHAARAELEIIAHSG